MDNENRERLALRMQPETRRRIEQWYAADNCQSMNEFVEKAVNFYVDHLEVQDNQTLLPMAIQSAIDGRLSRMEDYIARSSFTRNVEQDMTNGIIAEAFRMAARPHASRGSSSQNWSKTSRTARRSTNTRTIWQSPPRSTPLHSSHWRWKPTGIPFTSRSST